MAKVSLAEHMKEHRTPQPEDLADSGPYVTISRQYGCQGFSLGLLLLDILNDDAQSTSWQVYHKEILSTLATETNLGAEFIERQRRTKPSMIVDFLLSLKRDKTPSGYEIRRRITAIIRTLAIEGHAIIIGQGGAGATQDIPNGLSIRLEAPEDWRVKQVAFTDGMTEPDARQKVRDREREREYLRKLYETKYPRRPAFNITYDCSMFSLAHIAQHIVQMMKYMKCV
jgi:cytidylate kinase